MNYSAIVLSAGTGTRMNLGYNKMLLTLGEKPLFILSIETFLKDPNCKQILLMINEQDTKHINNTLEKFQLDKACEVILGGATRQESVYNGLKKVKEEIVLVHDGARPFITQDLITSLVENTMTYQCAIPAVKVKDTIKIVYDDFIESTLPRELLYAVQTPQAVKTKLLLKAHDEAIKEQFIGTDEASLIEKYMKIPVRIVLSSYENIKITTQEDLFYAKLLYPKYFK